MEKIFELVKQIPFGEVSTYKELGKALDLNPRVVGNLLNKNKDPENIKCFKIVKSDGYVGGYKLGVKEKIRRLRKEGIKIEKSKIVDFEKVLHHFK